MQLEKQKGFNHVVMFMHRFVNKRVTWHHACKSKLVQMRPGKSAKMSWAIDRPDIVLLLFQFKQQPQRATYFAALIDKLCGTLVHFNRRQLTCGYGRWFYGSNFWRREFEFWTLNLWFAFARDLVGRSPPSAEYALAKRCHFCQPTLPCWLRASWERVDWTWHHH